MTESLLVLKEVSAYLRAEQTSCVHIVVRAVADLGDLRDANVQHPLPLTLHSKS